MHEREHNNIIKSLIEPHDKARREDLREKAAVSEAADQNEEITKVVQ